MIDPKELRIGNWVFDDKTKVQLTAQSISMIVTGGLNYRKVSFDPIPLTPEWLERLGFKYTDVPDDDYSKNGITIYGSPFEDYWRVEQINHIGMGQKPPKIKYVHQLQNLFFALTGEEL